VTLGTFRGPSVEAIAALTEELTDKVSPAESATVGSELVAVADTLRHEGALRRIFTDVAVASDAEVAIIRQLFGGKISDTALEFVVSAVCRRWTNGGDLATGIDLLGVKAIVLSAGDQGQAVVDELFGLAELVRTTPELRSALSDPARSVADKSALLDSLLGGKVQAATLELAKLALNGTRGVAMNALMELRLTAAEALGVIPAVVHSAKQLGDEQLGSITSSLAKRYGKKVHVNVVIEPSLVGGVLVEIGDDVIDGSISSRLAEAGRLLAAR